MRASWNVVDGSRMLENVGGSVATDSNGAF
jgi:hypothetical protein